MKWFDWAWKLFWSPRRCGSRGEAANGAQGIELPETASRCHCMDIVMPDEWDWWQLGHLKEWPSQILIVTSTWQWKIMPVLNAVPKVICSRLSADELLHAVRKVLLASCPLNKRSRRSNTTRNHKELWRNWLRVNDVLQPSLGVKISGLQMNFISLLRRSHSCVQYPAKLWGSKDAPRRRPMPSSTTWSSRSDFRWVLKIYLWARSKRSQGLWKPICATTPF